MTRIISLDTLLEYAGLLESLGGVAILDRRVGTFNGTYKGKQVMRGLSKTPNHRVWAVRYISIRELAWVYSPGIDGSTETFDIPSQDERKVTR